MPFAGLSSWLLSEPQGSLLIGFPCAFLVRGLGHKRCRVGSSTCPWHLVKGGEEELGDSWVGGAAGIDAWVCLLLGMVDLLGL